MIAVGYKYMKTPEHRHISTCSSCFNRLCSRTQPATQQIKMKLCVLLALGTLTVLVHGMPPINRDFNTHCRCLQFESRMIPPQSLKSIKLVPEGPHCTETEVIASLTSGADVCLNPESPWVKKLVQFVLEKQLQKKKAAAAEKRA
ncbi:C-X-C motif chemokine 19 [Nothobranchius furzeri]